MILLVNDDGPHAPGLRTLYAALRKHCQCPVLAVAPAREQSGQSQAITIHRSLRVTPHHEQDFFGFAIDGTPTVRQVGTNQPLWSATPVGGIGHQSWPQCRSQYFLQRNCWGGNESAVMGYAAVA